MHSNKKLIESLLNPTPQKKATNKEIITIVRCRDCKHYVWDEFDGCYVCLQLSKYVKQEFFCAYGEEKRQ